MIFEKKERVYEMLISDGYQVDRFTKDKDDTTALYYNSVKLAKAVTICRNNEELSDVEKRELAMLLIAPDFGEKVTYNNSKNQSIAFRFDDVKEFITWQASQSGGGRKYIFCDGQEGSNKYQVAEEYFDWETGILNEKGKAFKENELQQYKNKR